jgi:DNA-binding FrmR family transcriptional regulator
MTRIVESEVSNMNRNTPDDQAVQQPQEVSVTAEIGVSDTEAVGCTIHGERQSHHSDQVKSSLTTRLNRIEGQIRGVKGMIERDTYCDDVLNQIAAIQSALNGVGKILLEGHMKSCLVERLEQGDTDVIDELLKTMGKLMK